MAVEGVTMATTFYVRGPNGCWRGVCEVDDEGDTYIHHMAWPLRNTHKMWLKTPLTQLLATGNWAPMIPEDLQVEEGL